MLEQCWVYPGGESWKASKESSGGNNKRRLQQRSRTVSALVWTTLLSRRQLHLCNFIYKSLKGLVPTKPSSIAPRVRHHCKTRSGQLNVVLLAMWTKFRKKSITYQGTRTLNKLLLNSARHWKSFPQFRDAGNCHFVLLLYSSFFKYLHFHIWLYSRVFNFSYRTSRW